jgi:uncharacterized protein (TIGR02679 family)
MPLEALDVRLRESGLASSLRDLLEELGGPLRDRPSERADEEHRWAQLWEDARAHPGCQSDELQQWLESLRRFGTLKQLAPGAERELLLHALAVISELPRNGIPRSQLASELFADPHALDSTEQLQTLVLGALAAQTGIPRPRDAAGQRDLWRRFGVLCDSLSCDVLTRGLRPLDDSPSAQALRIDADAGRPERLTLQDVQLDELVFAPGQDIFICENPAVVLTAGERLGPSTHPLVCTDGHPNTAVFVLLERLANCGANLYVQADFDWEGLRIAEVAAERFGARPWRFDADTYRRFANQRGRQHIRGRKPTRSRWTALHAAMSEVGIGVYEEDIIDQLVADLASGKRNSAGVFERTGS